MKLIFSYSMFFFILLSSAVFSDPPVVTYNVHVIKQATPSQCTSSWRGSGSPDAMNNISRIGQDPVESPGIVSCSSCAIDAASRDCVCKRCYEYFNN